MLENPLVMSVTVLAVAASLVLTILWVRRSVFLDKGIEPSWTADNWTGLSIIVVAVVAMGLLSGEGGDFSGTWKELAKQILGTIGALFLKSGYEKQEKKMLAQKTSGSSPTTANSSKTTLFFQHEEQETATQGAVDQRGQTGK